MMKLSEGLECERIHPSILWVERVRFLGSILHLCKWTGFLLLQVLRFSYFSNSHPHHIPHLLLHSQELDGRIRSLDKVQETPGKLEDGQDYPSYYHHIRSKCISVDSDLFYYILL